MAMVFVLSLLVAVILAVSYLLSTELDRGTQRRACVERLLRYISMQSVKVVIVTWQIVIQVRWSGLVNRMPLCRSIYVMLSLGRKRENTHTIILLHLVYCLTSDKVQIDDEIHKENQHIRN